MSRRNDSSQMKECLTHSTTDSKSQNNSVGSVPKTGSLQDSKPVPGSERKKLQETDQNKKDLKEANSKKKDPEKDPKREDSKIGVSGGGKRTTEDQKGAAGKELNSELEALNITTPEEKDQKIADGKGLDSKKAEEKKGSDLGGEGSKGANSNAMGANGSSRPADSNSRASNGAASSETSSNGAASSETSSNGASPNQQSGKRKLSQTSLVASGGSTQDPGEKLKREPECHMDLDKLRPMQNHTVLIDINKSRDDLFVPYKGQPHVWDNLHVKLPFNFPKNASVSRWEVTKKALHSLTKGKASVKDVEVAIMSYNQKYQKEWKFYGLNSYVQQLQKHENNFPTLISKMAKLALKLPDYIQHAIPLLKQNQNRSITLSQVQISCLLAHAFFCTFPHRNETKPNSEYANFPTINFSGLFSEPSQRKIQKLRALFHYFNTVTEDETRPKGLVTFERICIAPGELPNWKKQLKMLTNLHVYDKGSIETEGKGLLQVDFAAKYVGGGVLGKGLVQEEIRFLMCPELIVARLFTEKLGDNECLKITGAQTYSLSSGYSDSFTWLGPNTDDTIRDEWKRRYCQIVAIDALNFKNPMEQYTERNVKRELNKAFVGFRRDPSTPPEFTSDIATGNWGCGAFNGDSQLKALIQMMAAAVAERNLAFFTFGSMHQAHELQKIHDFLKTNNISVGRLYTLLVQFCEKQHYKSKHVFEFIREKGLSSQL